jgi:hypothetical protein
MGGVAQDHGAAFDLYSRAAQGGDSMGMSNLSLCYIIGEGVAQDDSLAFRCAMIAAQGGSKAGHNLVGRFYEHGVGISPSKADALRWYASGAALGNGRAAASLARLQAEEE